MINDSNEDAIIVEASNLKFEYQQKDDEGNQLPAKKVLKGVDLKVKKGEFIAILGANGSGKSTFAKHINALLIPDGGTIWVDKLDTSDSENILKVRKTAGMVFQNPDNQMLASVVDEEVAFGPENLGLESKEIVARVAKSLEAVGMCAYKKAMPTQLSGGQKQRVAIAGILAMLPKCIVLDEPTSMLDPQGRKDLLDVLTKLNKENGITIILITHNMEEVIGADKLFIMDDGKVVLSGSPRRVFSEVELLEKLKLDVPEVTKLAYELRKKFSSIPKGILNSNELVAALKRLQNGEDICN